MNNIFRNGIAAYAQANNTRPQTEAVVILYDGVIRHLMDARRAYENQQRAETARLLNKASNIVEGLRQSLREEYSPSLYNSLNSFYASCSQGISKQVVNKFEDTQFRRLLANIRTVRNAWASVADVKKPVQATPPQMSSAPSITVEG